MREKKRDPAEHNNELTIGQFDAFFLAAVHKKRHKSLGRAQKSDLFQVQSGAAKNKAPSHDRGMGARANLLWHLDSISPTATMGSYMCRNEAFPRRPL